MTTPTQAQIEAAAKILKPYFTVDMDAQDLAKASLAAAAEVGESTDLEANRLYRYLNGLDQDNHDKRAEHIMQQSLDGLTVGPTNRNSTKEILANHFEAIEAATIERCAQVAENFPSSGSYSIAAAIRAIKDKP